MSYYNYSLDKYVSELKFVPYKLHKGSSYMVGKTYWCGYWHKYYKVLEVNGRNVKIQWSDGKICEHCTSLDTLRDYILKPFTCKENPINKQIVLTAAEIRALCCAGIIPENYAYLINQKYYMYNKYKPNDHSHYLIKSKSENVVYLNKMNISKK